MKNRYPYSDGGRFPAPPDSTRQVISPYDQDSNLFQDLKQRGLSPVKVIENLDLTVAGQLFVDEPGYHFVIYGHEGSVPDPSKPVNTTVLVNIWINGQNNQSGKPFGAKHGRGFSGPFGQLYLEWPAQPNGSTPVFADLYIFKGSQKPWIDGETPT